MKHAEETFDEYQDNYAMSKMILCILASGKGPAGLRTGGIARRLMDHAALTLAQSIQSRKTCGCRHPPHFLQNPEKLARSCGRCQNLFIELQKLLGPEKTHCEECQGYLGFGFGEAARLGVHRRKDDVCEAGARRLQTVEMQKAKAYREQKLHARGENRKCHHPGCESEPRNVTACGVPGCKNSTCIDGPTRHAILDKELEVYTCTDSHSLEKEEKQALYESQFCLLEGLKLDFAFPDNQEDFEKFKQECDEYLLLDCGRRHEVGRTGHRGWHARGDDPQQPGSQHVPPAGQDAGEEVPLRERPKGTLHARCPRSRSPSPAP